MYKIMKKTVTLSLVMAFILSFCSAFSAQQQTQAQVIENFKKGLYVGDWVPNTSTEEHVKMLAESGIQYTFLWYFSYDNPKKVQELKWCEKYGIKVILKDIDIEIYAKGVDEIAAMTADEIYEIIKPSIGNPTIIGYNIYDEPVETEYEVLSEYLAKFKSVAQGMIPFVNLYPNRYGSYIDQVFTTLQQDFVSVDIYPLEGTTQSTYYYNLKAVADSAKKHGGAFWMFIQSMAWGTHRLPNIYDLRFQAYSSMAFGASKLMHFCYANALQNDAAAVVNGVKTDQYYVLQQFDFEMQFLAPILNQYKNLGTFYVEGQADTPSYVSVLSNESMYKDFRSVIITESDQCLLLGAFDSNTDSYKKAFMVVNASDCVQEQPTDISFTLRYSDKPVTVTMEGRTFEVEADDKGVYHLHLGAGGGAFIEIQERERTTEELQRESFLKRCNDAVAQYGRAKASDIYDYDSMEELEQIVNKYIDRIESEDIEDSELIAAAEELERGLAQLKTVVQVAESMLEQFEQIEPELFDAKDYNRLFVYVQRIKSELEPASADVMLIRSYLRALSENFNKLEFIGLSGDMTQDGAVTLADIVRAAKYVLGSAPPNYTQMRIGDMNGDLILKLDDVLIIARVVLQR